MYCSECGAVLDESATTCPVCGKQLKDPDAIDKAKVPRQAKGKAPIIIAVVAVLALAAVGLFAFMGPLGKAPTHPVLFTVSAPIPEGSSRIPVHVTGADAKQNAVDEVQYVDTAGQGMSLSAGQYALEFPSGPLTPDGTFFRVEADSVQLSIDESLKRDEVVDVRDQVKVSLVQMDAKDVTDEEIEVAAAYAKADPNFKGSVDGCKAKAVEQRDTAVRKAEEERAAKEAEEKRLAAQKASIAADYSSRYSKLKAKFQADRRRDSGSMTQMRAWGVDYDNALVELADALYNELKGALGGQKAQELESAKSSHESSRAAAMSSARAKESGYPAAQALDATSAAFTEDEAWIEKLLKLAA